MRELIRYLICGLLTTVVSPVSYTHLDVYKRQVIISVPGNSSKRPLTEDTEKPLTGNFCTSCGAAFKESDNFCSSCWQKRCV